ncbi:NAD(P)H-quinone oxidoreductase [Ciceribacter azotifigens]|uniref:NAD(P)H-quinone oxidoreductase n=1 Tax=Ciceribacter azotifigens TaxID=2069303 RepID=UPI003A862AF3
MAVEMMRFVEVERPGGPDMLQITEGPKPSPGEGEVLIRVAAAGVNRPDVQQRRGLYPPPPGASKILGLDVSGLIEQVGENVRGLAEGDAVCALTNGGGYAEYCTVPAVQCLPVPRGLSFAEAASLPEVFFTAWNNLIWLARLEEGESLLIQGGTSGVGLAGIQIARILRKATVYVTASTAEKQKVCIDLGAAAAVDYRGAWDQQIRDLAGGSGINVILDAQAGPYTQRQLDLLTFDGRLVFIASHLGETATVNVRSLVRRRLTMTGSTLRPRPPAYKGRLAQELIDHVWPLIEAGQIVTRVHSVMPLEEVAAAHEILDANQQIGKVVLAVDRKLAHAVHHSRQDGRFP